ncbi:unnamed protein product [Mytilus edulis]|uniref:Uncharacterized protein n=1 Tax=Mytilus edulis TaxID=6550 RepID=A0A8S3SWP2_MYTED|nr:unnamed protein product [Mytilus edulis]
MLGAKPVVCNTTFREYDDENKILIRQSVEEGGCHIDVSSIEIKQTFIFPQLAESKDQEVTITIDGINRSINKLLMLGAKPVVYTTFREYDDENKILIRQSVEEGGCHIDAESKDQEVTITIDGINRSINKLLMLAERGKARGLQQHFEISSIEIKQTFIFPQLAESKDQEVTITIDGINRSINKLLILAESKDQEVTITIDGINRSINKLLMLGAKPVVYTTFREYDDENKILIRQSVEEGGCHIDAESKDQEVIITIDGINRSINKLLMLGAKPVVYTTFREYDDENKILIRQSVEEGGCHIDVSSIEIKQTFIFPQLAESKDQEVTITIDGINRSINKLLMLGAKPVVYTTFRESMMMKTKFSSANLWKREDAT